MGFPVLSRVFSSPSPSSSSSSRLRGPASHAPVNPGVGPGTGMRQVEGKTLLCLGGCFGVGGGRHASKAAHQTLSRENQGKKNKPFAVIRRFLRSKSKSSSTNVFLADEDNDADRARVPAAGSHDTGAVIGSVTTDISGLEIFTVAEKIDRETADKSLPSFSSTEIHTTITCDDKEGDHDWMVSPIFQSFRFDCSGEDGASTPEILLVDDKLDIISLADASSVFSSNGKEGSLESTVSPILNSARLTSGSVNGADTREIPSEIPPLEKGEEETTWHSLDNGSLSKSRSMITSIDEELDCETRVTLETLMAMENLLPEERNDRGVEGEFEVRDCASGSVCCSPLVCLSNMQGRMTVEPSSGSTFFAHPDALFPPSPRRLSSSSGSTVTSADEALDEEMTAISEMLMSMETFLPCDGEVEEFGIRNRISGSVSRSPFVCWSNRQGRMTVEPSSGSSFFAHPDTLFPPSPLMLSSPSLCSPSSVCSERNPSKDNGAENTWIVSVSRTPDTDEGENMSNSPPSHYSPRNQWTVASTSESEDWESREIPALEKEEEETTGHSLDNGSLSESRSTITSIDEELDGETRVTLETLMAMENLLPEERNDRGVEGEFEVRDCVSGSVCCSPLVCLSNMQGGMTVELSSGSTFFAHPDALFPPSPHRLSSPSGSTVTSVDEAVDEEMTAISEMLMSMETLLPCDGEVEEFGIRDRVSGSVSRSPFVCWSNRQGRMTVEPLSGSSFFAHPDTLFPLSPLMRPSPSLCSPSSVCSERNRSKDNGAENTWIVSVSRTPDADKGENTSNSPRNHYSPRNQWTVASTSKSEDWESRVTVEMLMSLENLVSEETSSGEVEIELGARDCISRPISRSPLVCWSH